MKQIEREMKGEDADATDDEVCTRYGPDLTQAYNCRTTFSHPHTQMRRTMMLKTVLVQSMLHVAEHTSKPTESLKMMRDEDGLLWPGKLSSLKTRTQTTRSKKPAAALPDLLVLTATKQSLITTS
jgi:hypothetical protein